MVSFTNGSLEVMQEMTSLDCMKLLGHHTCPSQACEVNALYCFISDFECRTSHIFIAQLVVVWLQWHDKDKTEMRLRGTMKGRTKVQPVINTSVKSARSFTYLIQHSPLKQAILTSPDNNYQNMLN